MSTRRQRPKKNRGERLTLKDLASHLDLLRGLVLLKKDLCLRFTQRTVDPMWAVQWIGMQP